MFLAQFSKIMVLLLFSGLVGGCMVDQKTEAQEERRGMGRDRPVSVDVIRVDRESLQEVREYIGTTEPVREVILRSQAEGQLLNLSVDVGDRVTAGQTIARLDDTLLKSALLRAEGELSSLNAERIRAVAEISDAQSQVESARVRLRQAQTDANRLEQLYQEGAIALREVEVARTEEDTAIQNVTSAQSQVRVRESSVNAIEGRIQSQQAIIAEAKQRLAYTEIQASSTGLVLERLTQPGNLVQPGGEILRIGDFSQVKVEISVSELDLGNFNNGTPVRVRLDAFPNQVFSGTVSTISPAADASVRQIPVEIILDTNSQSINSGLLARVTIADINTSPITIPENALSLSSENGDNDIVFVLDENGDESQVIARTITIGNRQNGNVEVVGGLRESERLVVRSSQPLEDRQKVNLSIISSD